MEEAGNREEVLDGHVWMKEKNKYCKKWLSKKKKKKKSPFFKGESSANFLSEQSEIRSVWVLSRTGMGLKPGPTTLELNVGALCPFLGPLCRRAAPSGYHGWMLCQEGKHPERVGQLAQVLS